MPPRLNRLVVHKTRGSNLNTGLINIGEGYIGFAALDCKSSCAQLVS